MTKISMRYMFLFLASPHRQYALMLSRRYVSHATNFPSSSVRSRKSCTADNNNNNNNHDRRDYQGDKTSHLSFFRNRDWKRVEKFWTNMVNKQQSEGPQSSSLPDFVRGDDLYGLANLHSLHTAGMRGEFFSSDYRYSHRQTFAIRLGYVGTEYQGYQSQKGVDGIFTVEDDIKISLQGWNVYGAGRTDSGVSAISQVVCFHTTNMTIKPMDILTMMKQSEPCSSGRLAVYDVYRVPKKFNARSSATWRRYQYLLPLNHGIYDQGHDVDVSFVNILLQKIEGKELSYNGFATGEDRNVGEGLLDYCTLYRARAFVVDLSREQGQLSASMQDNSSNNNINNINNAEDMNSYQSTDQAMCVELVGSRFLRQMVRVLVATSARESVLPLDQRNEQLLMEICASRDRSKAAVPVPGEALCFCGVGYDSADMAIYKYMKKMAYMQILAENQSNGGPP